MLPWINKNQSRIRTAIFGLVLFVVAFLFLQILPVSAQGGTDPFGLQPIDQTTILAKTDIRLIIAQIIRAIFGLLGTIALVIMLYAGYTIMTSGGNEEKVAEGKKIMINAVIGLAIILSALAIVQFVINMLSSAINGTSGRGNAGAPIINTFAGSGALGKVVKDHYPFRDQTAVPRNTSVVVTFFNPIDPGSIIVNTNKTCWGIDDKPTTTCQFSGASPSVPYYGDCLDFNPKDDKINRLTECDAINTSTIGIFEATSTYYTNLSSLKLIAGSALTIYEDGAERNNYTFIFKPYDFIGDEIKDVWYSVRLTNNVLNKNSTVGVFSNNLGRKNYEWNFQTNTQIDFTPPYVVDTYPTGNETGKDIPARNSIIQINFSEAMDPTSVQGQIIDNPTSFANVILNTNFGVTPSTTLGNWKLSNRYQTLEFVSNLPCGQNSCGETMYCLPLDCASNVPACTKTYQALVRTADLMPGAQLPFEGMPFSGAMDMASNALDNDDKGKLATPHKPKFKNPLLITVDKDTDETKPDNYFWDFKIVNEIDTAAPYIQAVEPSIDQEDVPDNAPLKMYFNNKMWLDTVYGIKLEEYPAGTKGVEPIWFNPISQNIGGKTVTRLDHRVFGPNNTDLYYFPSIPSTIKNLLQNCLYPGRGPVVPGVKGKTADCVVEYNDEDGTIDFEKTKNCVAVETDSDKDTGCVQFTDLDLQINSTVTKCLSSLKTEDVSPMFAVEAKDAVETE